MVGIPLLASFFLAVTPGQNPQSRAFLCQGFTQEAQCAHSITADDRGTFHLKKNTQKQQEACRLAHAQHTQRLCHPLAKGDTEA